MKQPAKQQKGSGSENLPPSAKKVTVPDFSDLEFGFLWIQMPDGSFINIAASPQEFDRAVIEYVDLLDREKWPMKDRVRAIIQAEGDIPVYKISPEDLTKEMLQVYNQIPKPEEIDIDE